jgi:exodeoxyribonuclease VII small subunit
MPENKSSSFEASLARLEAIVKELEGDGVDLERSVALFNEGRTLVKHCEDLLKKAETTLKTAVAPPGGTEDEAVLEDEIPF